LEFRADKRVVSEKGAWNAPLTPKTFKKGMTGPNLKRGLDVPLSPRFLSREQGSNQVQGTMAKTSVAILTLALLAFGGFASPKQEAPQKLPSNPLERQVPYYTVELLPTRVAFQAAPGPARAPGGVASVFDCEQDAPRQVFRGMGQKIGDVMEQLVSADPRYRREMDDGSSIYCPLPASLHWSRGGFRRLTQKTLLRRGPCLVNRAATGGAQGQGRAEPDLGSNLLHATDVSPPENVRRSFQRR